MSDTQTIKGIPDGWELVRIGLIDPYDPHEHCIDPDGEIVKTFGVMGKVNKNYPIVRKGVKWRAAKPSDLEFGNYKKARFRDEETGWREGFLIGVVDRTPRAWVCATNINERKDNETHEWEFCEVQE